MASGAGIASGSAARTRSGRRAGAFAEALAAWVLAGPAIALMWVMLLGPAFAVIVLSFTDWLFGAPTIQWIGFGNYIELCGDKVFWQSLRNTLAYVAFTVPVSVFLGLGIALMIVNRLATLPPERLAMLPPAARIYLRA